MSSRRDADKGDLERAIFERFAEDAGLVVRPQSITQPDPPDILCDVEGLGQVAFELVQLDDTEELQRMGYLIRGREFWADATKGLPAKISQRHRGAQINVEFDPKSNQKERRAALDLIAAALADLPEAAEGALFKILPDGVVSAELKHFPMTEGPLLLEVSGYHIYCSSARAGVAPVGIDLARIDKKITHYREGWGMRAELLAYARWGMPFSDQMHRVAEVLAQQFPNKIFARGWIYELTSRRIVTHAS
jgi:hypothetical protein